VKENLEKGLCDIQKEVPIKSTKSFLYEYWNVFFYLYSKKLLQNFKNDKSKSVDLNILESISINNIFKDSIDNLCQIKDKESIKSSISLNNNIPINNTNHCRLNLTPPNNIKSSLFQPQNNNMGIGNNYLYSNFNGIAPNPQNDLFMSQIPRIQSISNNMLLNPFSMPKVIKNTFGNELRPNLMGDIENVNNLDPTNVPFFQIPIQNPVQLNPLTSSIVSTNNIIPNTVIPNNFLLTNNNANIHSNSNININKNINNIIKVDNINNNNINIHTNAKNENENKNPVDNQVKDGINKNESNQKVEVQNKVNLTSKVYSNTNNNGNSNIVIENSKKSTDKEATFDSVIIPSKPKNLFKIKEAPLVKDEKQKNIMTSKKRKRFLKNNKLVFIQSDKVNENNEGNNNQNSSYEEENQNNDSLNSEKINELIKKNYKPRGSRYRGVSKNGSQWQVLIMVKKKKRYLGSFSNEEEAARAYDKVALQHHGIKAKTNYDYTKEELEKIMKGPKLLKIEKEN